MQRLQVYLSFPLHSLTRSFLQLKPLLNDERSMMISSSREKGFQAKQEGEINDGAGKVSKAPSSSRAWSGFRNPRIVRVSRSFGGKDRHSKVCTVRGLRDRRIRLSVPTAIQLYDLQDRLGLSQPSKVIDWLLDATKDDIDKLPPLQIPHGFGHQFHQPMLVSHESNPSQSSLAPFLDVNSMFIKDGGGGEDQSMAAKRYWDGMDAAERAKSKEVERENVTVAAAAAEKGKWIKLNEQENQELFPLPNHSSLPGLLNSAMPFNPYCHWEPSSLSLSQFGSHGFLPQTENFLNGNATVPLPSSLSQLPSAHAPQLFFCPPSTMPSLFSTYPPYGAPQGPGDSSDHSRQMNHFQLLGSNSQHALPNSATLNSPLKPFSLNVNAGFTHTENDDGSQADDDDQDNTDIDS